MAVNINSLHIVLGSPYISGHEVRKRRRRQPHEADRSFESDERTPEKRSRDDGSLFAATDGRSPWARRYRDMVALLVGDAGGLETHSELKLSSIRRCAALIVECERMELILADGGAVDMDLLARTSKGTLSF